MRSSLPVMLSIARFVLLLLALAGAARAADEMPEGFVYLRDVDPTIEQDIRYAGPSNFTGAPVPGYGAAECVLARPAAEALKRVQEAVAARGLTLKVYDCYRPARAVSSFVGWAQKPDDPSAKETYYPNLDKRALLPDYIATRSGHSRGATVDLTLEPRDATPPKLDNAARACTAAQKGQAPDGSVPMGTSFDCFDVKANTEASGLSDEERANRAALVEAMQAQGFENYPMEWWHFILKREPYPDTYFDFAIKPHGAPRHRPRLEPSRGSTPPSHR
jgi:D-alanyl-D-alanine dipeptidase